MSREFLIYAVIIITTALAAIVMFEIYVSFDGIGRGGGFDKSVLAAQPSEISSDSESSKAASFSQILNN